MLRISKYAFNLKNPLLRNSKNTIKFDQFFLKNVFLIGLYFEAAPNYIDSFIISSNLSYTLIKEVFPYIPKEVIGVNNFLLQISIISFYKSKKRKSNDHDHIVKSFLLNNIPLTIIAG